MEGIQQPKNIINLITKTRYREIPNTIAGNNRPGIYAECRDPRCQLCSLGYMKECSSFTTSNGILWEIKSHINCNTKNVIYFLTCNCCIGKTKVTKTGKCQTTLRKRMNNHKSECKSGNTSDVFDTHVHNCGIANNNLIDPMFEIRAFMSLSKPDKLSTYENEFHKRKYAIINT